LGVTRFFTNPEVGDLIALFNEATSVENVATSGEPSPKAETMAASARVYSRENLCRFYVFRVCRVKKLSVLQRNSKSKDAN
jgi:hypothetical protein